MDCLLERNTIDDTYQFDNKYYDSILISFVLSAYQFIRHYLTKILIDAITLILAVPHAQRGLTLGQLKLILAGLKKWKKLESDIQDFNEKIQKRNRGKD